MTTAVDQLVERLRRLDSCAVSDALDKLGLDGVLSRVTPMWPCGRIAGRVSTVELGPEVRDRPKNAPHLGSRAIDGASPGDIIVVDNNTGRDAVSGWGGLLGLAASLKGVAGVVVFGPCRDIDEYEELQLPVYAKAATPITARGRVSEITSGGDLRLGDVTVRQGDMLIADRSGAVVIDSSRAADVLTTAEDIMNKERAMAARLRAGDRVSDVLAANYEHMTRSPDQD